MKRKRSTALWIALSVLAILLVLVSVIMVKTLKYPFGMEEDQGEVRPALEPALSELTLKRFSGGIRIPTVSNSDYAQTDFEAFDEFKQYLRDSYPRIYKEMETETINDYGLVFHWRGEDPARNPILFLAHYDVVPVSGYTPDQYRTEDVVFRPEEGARPPIDAIQTNWEYPPFSGAVTGGRIYGRGTLDMKGVLFSVLEAADSLLAEGFRPRQDIWFAFGQDEETGGLNGAVHIAQHFKEKGLRFDAVYDEGSIVLQSPLKNRKPIALIGVAEKGFLTLKIKVRGLGGHSSMPPQRSSLVMAAEIIEKLSENQMPARIIPTMQTFVDRLGGETGFMTRMALANQWLFKPYLLKKLGKNPTSNALIRTTTAITMAKGSDAANVLSAVSEVTVNFRILPGDTVQDVIEHVKKICEGYEVELEVVNSREPSGVSSEDTRGYRIASEALRSLYPEAVVTSYITIGGTDAYKYEIVSDKVYRCMPVLLNTYEQRIIHNDNEYISFDNLGRMIAFYRTIMADFGEE